MNWKDLVQFIDRKPEYFEEVNGRQRIQERHATCLKTYSRLLDPDLFDEIHQRADAVLRERERQIQEQLVEMEGVLTDLQQRRSWLAQRMRNHAPAQAQGARVQASSGRSQGDSLWWPLLLDLLGAFFLYLGILGHQGVSVTLILLGSVLIGWGFLWTARISSKPKRKAAATIEPRPVPVESNKRKLIQEMEMKMIQRQITELEQDMRRMRNLLPSTECSN